MVSLTTTAARIKAIPAPTSGMEPDDWDRDLADLVEEIRPCGPIHESPEWDLYFDRASRIEALYREV
jgi:hypothetical protein